MAKKKENVSLYQNELKNKITSSNYDLLEVRHDLAGLNALVKVFYTSVVQNGYCGPEYGTREYNDMIDDVFTHIINALDDSTDALDEINDDIDGAIYKTA